MAKKEYIHFINILLSKIYYLQINYQNYKTKYGFD